MKIFLISVALVFTITNVISQNRSYVQIGPAAYAKTSAGPGFYGGGIGAGSSIGFGGAGVNVELLSRGTRLILPVYLDLRYYSVAKTTSPYFSLQAGYNFRNSQEPIKPYAATKDKGGVYIAGGVGYYAFKRKAPGINIQLKYVVLQNRFLSNSAFSNGYSRKETHSTHEGFISSGVFLVL